MSISQIAHNRAIWPCHRKSFFAPCMGPPKGSSGMVVANTSDQMRQKGRTFSSFLSIE